MQSKFDDRMLPWAGELGGSAGEAPQPASSNVRLSHREPQPLAGSVTRAFDAIWLDANALDEGDTDLSYEPIEPFEVVDEDTADALTIAHDDDDPTRELPPESDAQTRFHRPGSDADATVERVERPPARVAVMRAADGSLRVLRLGHDDTPPTGAALLTPASADDALILTALLLRCS